MHARTHARTHSLTHLLTRSVSQGVNAHPIKIVQGGAPRSSKLVYKP